MVLIEAQGLGVEGRLHDASFTLHAGEMLGVIGPNGAGKSTLLQSLAGLVSHQGLVAFEGQGLDELSPRERAQRIGYLPQESDSAWALKALDVVKLGRLPWNDEDAEAVEQAAQDTGIQALLHRPVNELSGGERARVWLARVLAGRPRLLLADEPIASLDLLHQRRIMELLRRHAEDRHAVILAIHDLGLAARYCDKFCLINQGRIMAFGTSAEVLTESILSKAFEVDMRIDLSATPPLIQPL
jgi:iron complex transport system ATP-binding protein